MDVITSHLNADFDSLASAIAATKLYPDAVIVFPGSMERRVRDFIDAFQPIDIKKIKEIHLDKVKRLIIVDTKHPDRIGPFKELLSRPDVRVHVYDHHPAAGDDIKGEVEVIDTAGAESTIFTEIIQEKKIPLTPMEATVLCLGIYEETGSLLFSSTTPRDLIAAAYLVRKGANLNIVSDFLKEEMSREEFSLLNELVKSLREIVIHGVRIKIGKGAMEGFGDVSHLAPQVMDMEEADAVVLLIGMADKILIVARSKVAELDVSQVLSDFGGGGHPAAASVTIKDMPFEIIEERLIVSLYKYTRPVKLVRDVMTKPVISITWNSTIKEAERVMTRYGVNALPVVRNDRYRGIITRGVVEKALFHVLGRSRCEDFATTDAITASPDTPIAEMERSMIEQNQRFVTVLEADGRVAGAVTRTDILRSLYEDFMRKSRVSSKESLKGAPASGIGRNIPGVMRGKLPAHLFDLLVMAGKTADELGYGVYLVGGCVRDLLRGEANLDIDIVVEGDGIAFAKKLGKKIGAKIIVHKKFGTAKVIIEDGNGLPPLRLDVATARTEYYESPAALPKVEMSSIKKDLYRRDFTINTLAVKLNKKDFGMLIDFFGGQRDLKDKAVRVLHNLSFVEDPTRAFRAIRFAERFGFKLTKHTENLMKLAIRMNIFEKLSGTRIYDELMLTFNETSPIKALKRLGDYSLLKVIHPKLVFTPWLEALLQSVHDTISWFELLFLKEEYNKGVLYIMALLYKLTGEEREVALARLAVPAKLKERIAKELQAVQDILRMLGPDNPVEIYQLLSGRGIESILFSMALTQDSGKKKAISRYLLQLRSLKPLLKGTDLQALCIPQGPVYSEIFRRVHAEKLMGGLNTKEEELAFVKKIYKGVKQVG
ncbi:MAG: CBS domain-containing protein [Nitrospirae bacterium]|nr:CBS domain-containing protein [Nitrospirota bacterium]MCL5238812.1 CBS domain-containing protein [Nitrospirota bacterium]